MATSKRTATFFGALLVLVLISIPWSEAFWWGYDQEKSITITNLAKGPVTLQCNDPRFPKVLQAGQEHVLQFKDLAVKKTSFNCKLGGKAKGIIPVYEDFYSCATGKIPNCKWRIYENYATVYVLSTNTWPRFNSRQPI